MKKKHEKKLSDFKFIFYAFSNKQFLEGMEKLWITNNKLLFNNWFGGYILKKYKEEYLQIFLDIDRELLDWFKNDKFLFQAFKYELSNHEFYISYDYTDTLNCLWLKYEKLTNREKIILDEAAKKYLNEVDY